MRREIALWICPALQDELDALRSGNTKAVLQNQCLMDELTADQVAYCRERVDATRKRWADHAAALTRR